MEPTDFPVDTADMAALAFRLNWPGQVAKPNPAPKRKASPKDHTKKAGAAFAKFFLPQKLVNRIAARFTPLEGWPVTLSAPGPEVAPSWLPSVKLTGRPLD